MDLSCNGRVHTSAGGSDTALRAAQGLVTLLILPIANAANQHLQSHDTYWKLNVTQVHFGHPTTALYALLACRFRALIAGAASVLLCSLHYRVPWFNKVHVPWRRLWCCCRCSASAR